MKNIEKYIYKPVVVLLAILTFQSCSDLEEDLSSLQSLGSLSSGAEMTTAITPMYRQIEDVFGRTPHFLRTPTYGADDITTWTGGNKEPLRVFDRFDYGAGENSDNAWLPFGWNAFWKVIYYGNSLIDGLKTSTADEDVVNRFDAEARFLRALSYIHLVKTHGNMPIIIDGMIPSVEEKRATVLENYKQIESDLLIAETHLPAPGASGTGRASSGAAKALLADLYLTWAGWPVKDASKYQLAANKAKEVIDMGYYALLPIDQLWLLENGNSLESLFAIQFSESENIRSGLPAAFSFHMARGWSDAYPEFQFFNDFPAGARKDATFATDIPNRGVAKGVIFTKDPATKPWEASDRKHPMYKKFTISEDITVAGRTSGFRAVELIRYAEVLLIFAEAQARVGETAASIEALNQVKRRAAGLDYLTPNALVDVTTATANEIIDEKGWELAGEHKRWFDLIRSERLEEITLKRDGAEEVVLNKQPTKDNYIAPIPQSTMSTTDWEQNPAGFKIQ